MEGRVLPTQHTRTNTPALQISAWPHFLQQPCGKNAAHPVPAQACGKDSLGNGNPHPTQASHVPSPLKGQQPPRFKKIKTKAAACPVHDAFSGPRRLPEGQAVPSLCPQGQAVPRPHPHTQKAPDSLPCLPVPESRLAIPPLGSLSS